MIDVTYSLRERMVSALAASPNINPESIIIAREDIRERFAPRKAIVVSIGRNIGAYPMPSDEWDLFGRAILAAVKRLSGNVYSDTFGASGADSDWQEDSRVISAEVPDYALNRMRLVLGGLAHRFGQECIALTIGATEFVRGES